VIQYEDSGYNFYGYNTSQSQWSELGSIPYPLGYYVGNRLAFADDHIYYLEGSLIKRGIKEVAVGNLGERSEPLQHRFESL